MVARLGDFFYFYILGLYFYACHDSVNLYIMLSE